MSSGGGARSRREKVLVVDAVRASGAHTAETLARGGFESVQALTSTHALKLVASESPDLILLSALVGNGGAVHFVRRLKGDLFTRHIPILIFGAAEAAPEMKQELGQLADALVPPLKRDADLLPFVRKGLGQEPKVDPFIHLPTAPFVQRELDARLKQNQPTAVVYANIDRFRWYNQVYSRALGNHVLAALARLMVGSLPAHDAFIGYLGADNFIAVLRPETAETFAQTIVDRFRRERDSFYSTDHIAQGHIRVVESDGQEHLAPLMTLSAALVTNERRPLINYVHVGELLTDVMRYLKAQGGGAWARDRRVK